MTDPHPIEAPAEMKCLRCGDELRLEDIPGHLYAEGIEPPWEAAARAEAAGSLSAGPPPRSDRSRIVSEDGTSPGEWEAVGFYGSELSTDRPAYTVLTVYGEVARAFSAADARLIAAAVNAYRGSLSAGPPPDHSVRWVDAGRDEPPENGFWRCRCGVTFAPDAVDSGIAHGWAEAAGSLSAGPPPVDELRWHYHKDCPHDGEPLSAGPLDVPCVHPGCGLPDRLHGAPDQSRVTHSDHWYCASSENHAYHRHGPEARAGAASTEATPPDERKAAMGGRVGRYGWFDHDPDTADVAYECESDIDRCKMHPNGVWTYARRASTEATPPPVYPGTEEQMERDHRDAARWREHTISVACDRCIDGFVNSAGTEPCADCLGTGRIRVCPHQYEGFPEDD